MIVFKWKDLLFIILKIMNNETRISCAQGWQDDQCEDAEFGYCQKFKETFH